MQSFNPVVKSKLMLGDCIERIKEIPSDSVDMVITSPPYDSLRTYNLPTNWDYEVFKKIANELFRVLVKAGCVVWIISDSTVNGSESGSSFKQALYFKKIGFNIHDTMIWQKNSPYSHKNRYIQCFEYMFIFSKGFRKEANLIKDRKNKWAGTQVHGTERKVDGEIKNLSAIQKSKKIKEYGARFNIWDIPPDKNNKTNHPAVFPVRIAADHIKTWTNPYQTVLDPFMGSGTTGLACKKLNRNFIGIEKNLEYFDLAKNRIESADMGQMVTYEIC